MEKKLISKEIMLSSERKRRKVGRIVPGIIAIVLGANFSMFMLISGIYWLVLLFFLPAVVFGILFLCIKPKPSALELEQFYILLMPVVKKEKDTIEDTFVWYLHFSQGAALSVTAYTYCNTSVGDLFYVFFNKRTNRLFKALSVKQWTLSDDLKPFLLKSMPSEQA